MPITQSKSGKRRHFRSWRVSALAIWCFLSLMSPGSVAVAGNDEAGVADEAFAASGALIFPKVDFLEAAPIIDGALDRDLQMLPERAFNLIDKSSPDNLDTKASYRIAYGTEFFYLYVEAEGDGLNYRDRAYQNGDGFNLVLATPKPDNSATDEFYVLAAGAVKDAHLEWSRRIFWYHDVTDIFLRTSDDTKLEFQEKPGKIVFELLLPWKDVYPYHPWLQQEGIGFNLKFNKAVGEEREMNSLDVYDGDIWREGRKRDYNRLQFAAPKLLDGAQSYSRLARNNIVSGENIVIETAVVSAAPQTLELFYEMKSGEGETIRKSAVPFVLGAGLATFETRIEGAAGLPPGGYSLSWDSSIAEGAAHFSILRSTGGGDEKEIKKLKRKLSKTSFETLELYNQEIAEGLAELKSYALASKLRLKMATIEKIIKQAKAGRDILADKTGFFRKGFRSAIDQTLQPYTVDIPENYDPDKTYPLIVFLHGSASDETKLSGMRFLSPDCCIAVGPFARGHSNFYLGDDPQKDIAEAIEAVASAYSIDRDKIILTGFSMGGWGAFYTYAQNPDLYNAIAVFSGPAKLELDDKSWSFMQPKEQAVFRDANIFIFTGEKDNFVPVEDMRTFARMVEDAGARVELRINDRGHAKPYDEDIDAYLAWLDRVLKQ